MCRKIGSVTRSLAISKFFRLYTLSINGWTLLAPSDRSSPQVSSVGDVRVFRSRNFPPHRPCSSRFLSLLGRLRRLASDPLGLHASGGAAFAAPQVLPSPSDYFQSTASRFACAYGVASLDATRGRWKFSWGHALISVPCRPQTPWCDG